MDAVRCTGCGDVRWSLLGLKGALEPCRMCGAEMVAERRRPAAISADPRFERRHTAPVSPAAVASHPARPAV